MNEYIDILTRYVAENPPNYAREAHTILEMLYCYYHECNNADSDAVKEAFEELYQQMHGMPLREMDRVIDTVCVLCTEHERNGFIEGIKVGICLDQVKSYNLHLVTSTITGCSEMCFRHEVHCHFMINVWLYMKNVI